MAYHKTIFRQMLQLISRLEFQHIVKRYKGDHRARTLKCWDQFIHMLFAQLSHRESLRDTIQATTSHHEKLYHLGSSVVHRSTLSDANSNRSHQIYETLFYHLLERVQKLAPRYKLKLPRKLFVMDSTTIDLCLQLFPWARFRKTKAAVKIHTVMQADGSLPTFLNITEGSVHDSKASKLLKIPSGSFLVFDRGYHDFEQYKVYKNNKIRFITRMKTNAKYRIIKLKTVKKSTDVVSDEIIEFTGYYTHKKYPHQLRKITYHDEETGKRLVFLTNEFKLAATTVAKIYKARWEIELFFKTIKQNLKIKRFMGASRNAVMTQIWIAMIAYLLTSYYKFSQHIEYSIQNLFRLIQINLFERKCLIQLIRYGGCKPPDPLQADQLALFEV